MPRTYPPNVSPRAFCTISWLVLVGLLLSACAGSTLQKKVPAAELEAERQQRQALQVKQRQLLKQLSDQSAAQSELEEQFAAEHLYRQALEERHERLERDLKKQSAARKALNNDVAKLEKQLAAEDVKRQEWKRWQEQLERDLKQQTAARKALNNDVAKLENQLAAEGLKRREWEQAPEQLEQDLNQQAAARQSLDYADANLYLLLLEKKAHIVSLNEQIKKVILEVVRAKARLRSLESKAEAASNLAEAEIAVESLKARGEIWESDPSFIKAEQLTRLSAHEFEVGNYGGALYLTSQAKSLIEGARARSLSQEMSPMVEGEVSFVLPLRLQLLSESDVREGPSSHFEVLYSWEEGTALIGYAFRGQWVRVKSEDGLGGWVFYKSVGSN